MAIEIISLNTEFNRRYVSLISSQPLKLWLDEKPFDISSNITGAYLETPVVY